MQFNAPLVRGTLLRRYKRFLADVTLECGREVTAHCANPGAMTGMGAPGDAIWLEPNDDPKRKLKHSWKLTEAPGGHWICVDTGAANRIVAEALAARALPDFAAYDAVRPEAAYGTRSRVDFLLSAAGRPDLYLEVKTVTLRRSGSRADFPDCVTARGAKHLHELASMAGQGARAMMLYVVMRTDCDAVDLAADIDPAYAAAFDLARAAGVEARAVLAHIGTDGMRVARPAPVLRGT
jgi:sugar fermentation stimulation protein A